MISSVFIWRSVYFCSSFCFCAQCKAGSICLVRLKDLFTMMVSYEALSLRWWRWNRFTGDSQHSRSQQASVTLRASMKSINLFLPPCSALAVMLFQTGIFFFMMILFLGHNLPPPDHSFFFLSIYYWNSHQCEHNDNILNVSGTAKILSFFVNHSS